MSLFILQKQVLVSQTYILLAAALFQQNVPTGYQQKFFSFLFVLVASQSLIGMSSVRRLSIRRLAICRLFLCFNYYIASHKQFRRVLGAEPPVLAFS